MTKGWAIRSCEKDTSCYEVIDMHEVGRSGNKWVQGTRQPWIEYVLFVNPKPVIGTRHFRDQFEEDNLAPARYQPVVARSHEEHLFVIFEDKGWCMAYVLDDDIGYLLPDSGFHNMDTLTGRLHFPFQVNVTTCTVLAPEKVFETTLEITAAIEEKRLATPCRTEAPYYP